MISFFSFFERRKEKKGVKERKKEKEKEGERRECSFILKMGINNGPSIFCVFKMENSINIY